MKKNIRKFAEIFDTFGNLCKFLSHTGILEKYTFSNINSKTILDRKFNVKNLIKILNNHVKTFIKDQHKVAKNLSSSERIDESETDTLVHNLLVRVINMHYYPLRLSSHLRCRLHILSQSYITKRPKFVINKDDISMIVVEDKHLKNKNLISMKGYKEIQLVAEILACGDENMCQIARIAPQPDVITDQTIFAVRIISTYFTFYKTVIPAIYWEELESGLPQKHICEFSTSKPHLESKDLIWDLDDQDISWVDKTHSVWNKYHCPSLTSERDEELLIETIFGIFAEGKELTCYIGITKMSTGDNLTSERDEELLIETIFGIFAEGKELTCYIGITKMSTGDKKKLTRS
ncbi:hypothetical protein Glove_116g29 [Diversispora epigaea]|uniref:Uncharacterized protein n=1 Tax=Diversispora epigaea TaxID=1348612 RepID=A0A397J5E5_9GLOM|nr:hypothetical protein Glove_116g29 [Diversispora epigaea]